MKKEEKERNEINIFRFYLAASSLALAGAINNDRFRIPMNIRA